ncbi:FcoT family thioesterase [Streptomyces sp. NPDC050560]|uniref:(2E)-enoyl-ACP glycyltransferase n=1 Tax=Streptomyces sp. NPDC050560 TaxID=3365630 RepID=UPI0037BB67AE
MAPPHTVRTDPELLAQVLAPYKGHCRYIRDALVTGRDGTRVTVRSACEIPESCYIDDTGHLNSVEVNICYNQMMYYLVAVSVRESLLNGLGDWTLDDFWRHQLPDILIARFTARFRRPVDPRHFTAELEISSPVRRAPDGAAPFLHADSHYRCWDSAGGRCGGEAVLAFVNIP